MPLTVIQTSGGQSSTGKGDTLFATRFKTTSQAAETSRQMNGMNAFWRGEEEEEEEK